MHRTVIYLLGAFASSAAAQWLHYPTPGIPRTRDGNPNFSAPIPKLNGRPDLSGVWQIEPTPLAELKKLFGSIETFDVPGDDASLYSKYFLNVLSDYPSNESPMLPSAAEILRKRRERNSVDLPYTKCLPAGLPLSATLPFPFKVVQTPGLTVIIHESDSSVRQIYTDGRKHTPNPQPTWNGYSVGHWDRDTLAVRGGSQKTVHIENVGS